MDIDQKLILIQQITSSLEKSPTKKDVLDKVIHQIKTGWPDTLVYFFFFDKDRKLESYSYDGDDRPGVPEIKVDVGDGAIGLAALLRQPFYVSNASIDTKAVVINNSTSSQLAIPIQHKGIIIGVIVFESPELSAYDDQTQTLFGIITSSLAIILQNLEAEDRKNKASNRSITLAHFIQQIHSTNDIPTILKISAMEIAQASGALRVSISIQPGGDPNNIQNGNNG